MNAKLGLAASLIRAGSRYRWARVGARRGCRGVHSNGPCGHCGRGSGRTLTNLGPQLRSLGRSRTRHTARTQRTL